MQKGYETVISAVRQISAYFGPSKPIHEIDNKAVHAYISHCITSGVAPATINRRLSALKVLIKHAKIMGYTDQTIEISRLREDNARTLVLTETDYHTILSQLTITNLKHIIIVLYETGMRLSELLKLTTDDIDKNRGKYGTIFVLISKNGKPRTIPMTESVARVIDKRHPILFPYTHKAVYRMWSEMKRTVTGVDHLMKNDTFTPHILRHSCITNLASRGVPLADIQRWAGHTCVLTTSRYTHLQDDLLEKYV